MYTVHVRIRNTAVYHQKNKWSKSYFSEEQWFLSYVYIHETSPLGIDEKTLIINTLKK
jgi:hypothetical protein